MPSVKIHYHRPPDRDSIYQNELIYESDDVTVTIIRATLLARNIAVAGETILENGAPAIWFTFPDADHDVGRFHTAGGEFTGLYANIITPVEVVGPLEWRTTDLFLDLWIGRDGKPQILDEDELADALQRGWIDDETAREARRTADRLVAQHGRGTWPPPVVYDWPLERILEMRS